MSKMHELLAVKDSLRSQAEACRAELMGTFEKKVHHFTEIVKTFKPIAEDGKVTTESKLELQTTVDKEIAWISAKIAPALDVAYQIDLGNQIAVADIVVDGQTIAANVPATTLLELEKRIAELTAFVKSIPTLDPAKGFSPDAAKGEGIFQARDVETVRTAKVKKYNVMVAATDKHPAQVDIVVEDVPTGKLLVQEWSSLLTTAQKGDILDRVEKLSRAVKKARSKANETEVQQEGNKIGNALLGYVFGE